MKQIIAFVLFIGFILTSVSCSNNSVEYIASASETSTISPDEAQDQTNEAALEVRIRNADHMINQYQVYTVNASNASDKYINAEVYAYALNEDNEVIGHQTLFLNNLSPGDYEGTSMLVPLSDNVTFGYEIKKIESNETATRTPEITDNNIYEYVRISYNDYNDIYGNDKSVGVKLHNLTTQYMTAEVTVYVKDFSGNTLDSEYTSISNLNPYCEKTISMMFKITDDYTVEFSIDNYSFSDSPIA